MLLPFSEVWTVVAKTGLGKLHSEKHCYLVGICFPFLCVLGFMSLSVCLFFLCVCVFFWFGWFLSVWLGGFRLPTHPCPCLVSFFFVGRFLLEGLGWSGRGCPASPNHSFSFVSCVWGSGRLRLRWGCSSGHLTPPNPSLLSLLICLFVFSATAPLLPDEGHCGPVWEWVKCLLLPIILLSVG